MTLQRCPHCDRPSPNGAWCERCVQALERYNALIPQPTLAEQQHPAIERAADIVVAAKRLLEAARPIARVLPCSTVRHRDLIALAAAVDDMERALAAPTAIKQAADRPEEAPRPDRYDWENESPDLPEVQR